MVYLRKLKARLPETKKPQTKDNMNNHFSINQLVYGKAAGLFIIVGFRNVWGVEVADLKEVNPANHNEFGRGEVTLPLECIVAA